ncbi:MAG: hypothetical protein R3Y11_12495, partial [Pseudomonadota bacterium]
GCCSVFFIFLPSVFVDVRSEAPNVHCLSSIASMEQDVWGVSHPTHPATKNPYWGVVKLYILKALL